MASNSALTEIKFHFYSVKFTPRVNYSNTMDNVSIMRDVMGYLSSELSKGQGHLINKHQGREKDGVRELFMTSVVYMHKVKRIRCSIALLRAGRLPKLKPVDQFKLVPLNTVGDIAEETHFYIDYSKNYPVICIEYNYHGARMPDIEYYLRNIAGKTLKIAKTTKTTLYIGGSIDKTLKQLKNVLNFSYKIQPKNLIHLDTEITGTYFSEMNNFGNNLKPKFLKVEALFQTAGSKVKSEKLNLPAITMIKDILKRFKSRPYNIKAFTDFQVKYENENGEDVFFNLLKEKREISIEIDLNGKRKKSELYYLVENDFNEFMNSL